MLPLRASVGSTDAPNRVLGASMCRTDARNAYMVSARFPVRSHGLSEPLDESLCHLLDRLGSTGILE